MVKTASFCRHIEKDWLEQTLRWVASEVSLSDLNDKIEHLLSASIKTPENRRKARNLLISIWSNKSDQEFNRFFETSLKLHKKADGFSLAVHWGMLIAKKPFFAEVARFIGRQLRLNDSFTFAIAYRRLSMFYGETESTSRALSAVLRTMIELGVITRDHKTGCYQIACSPKKVGARISNWLLLAIFIADAKESVNFDDVLSDHVFFPFSLELQQQNIDSSEFEQLVQGNALILFKKR